MGVAKLADAPIIIAKIKGVLLTPILVAVAMAMGNSINAAALLVTISVRMEVVMYKADRTNQGLPFARATASDAINWAAPVISIAFPMPNAAMITSRTCVSMLRNAWGG